MVQIKKIINCGLCRIAWLLIWAPLFLIFSGAFSALGEQGEDQRNGEDDVGQVFIYDKVPSY